ncbi:MAG: hypothetical protein FWD12_06135, partial [Alphaproteobacteria bacterium]|nr:hypothetical protein [Alphaproteobacteria bacterium]
LAERMAREEGLRELFTRSGMRRNVELYEELDERLGFEVTHGAEVPRWARSTAWSCARRSIRRNRLADPLANHLARRHTRRVNPGAAPATSRFHGIVTAKKRHDKRKPSL